MSQRKEARMFDSRPKEREGEPIEDLIGEAIDTTASDERGVPESRRGGPPEGWTHFEYQRLLRMQRALVVSVAVAVLEALALLWILVS